MATSMCRVADTNRRCRITCWFCGWWTAIIFIDVVHVRNSQMRFKKWRGYETRALILFCTFDRRSRAASVGRRPTVEPVGVRSCALDRQLESQEPTQAARRCRHARQLGVIHCDVCERVLPSLSEKHPARRSAERVSCARRQHVLHITAVQEQPIRHRSALRGADGSRNVAPATRRSADMYVGAQSRWPGANDGRLPLVARQRFSSRIALSSPSSVSGYMRSLTICFMIWIEGVYSQWRSGTGLSQITCS